MKDDFLTAQAEKASGKDGSGMSIRDWIGGLLWALPLLVAIEGLTR